MNAYDDDDSDEKSQRDVIGGSRGRQVKTKVAKKGGAKNFGQTQNNVYEESESDDSEYVDDKGKPLTDAQIRIKKEKLKSNRKPIINNLL